VIAAVWAGFAVAAVWHTVLSSILDGTF